MAANDQQFRWEDGVGLKEHLLKLMEAGDKNLSDRLDALSHIQEDRLTAVEKAIQVAYANMERRLEGMNEFRNSLRDQNATFLTKGEHNANVDRLNKAIRDLELSRAELGGKASQTSVTNNMLLTVVGLLLAIVGIVLKFL